MSEISNPYIAGAPVVESSMFFGREDVFNWIERSLAGKYVNHILVLHGQRRVGKTSVLKQIPNFLPKNYIQVFFDLQGRTSTSLDRFLWWLASEIVRTLKKERDIDLPRPDRKAFEDTEYLIGEFLPSLRLILGEQILILTFDEFDTIDQPEIQENLAQPLIAYLRRLMEMDGLNFVFSIGSSGDKLENMQASYTDFFKSALYRKISFLTRDDCHRLITIPVEGVIQYDRKAVERIIEITSGHPYFTQLMCHELFALCQKTGERQIRAEDVEAILGDVIERGTVNLKFVWDEASDLEKWILAGIAMLDGGTSTQKLGHLLQEQRVRFSDADLNAAIIHLRDKDVLDQENHFVIQLMRMWLQANRPLDRVREELAEVNPIANRYIEIGDEYRDRGQSPQAIESYQQAIQADPGNLKAQFNIGAVHLEGGAYTQAAAAFELALQIDDEDVGARTGYCNATLALGDAARAEHQVETAIGYYEKILLFNPAHRDARLRLAEIYQQRAEAFLAAGQDDAALSAFNQAMDYTPENETLAARYDEVLAQKKAKVTAEWMGRAERAQARQRWDEAAGFVEEALKLDPQNEALQAKLLEVKDAPRQEKIRGYRQEAEQAIKRGNFEKAVGALETALLLSPGDETIISWLESARSNQRNAQLLLIREQVKRAVTAGDWEAAIQFIEKAQKTAPQQEDWDKQLAGIQAARHQAQLKACRQEADRARSAGNWDDAITALQKYRQLEPSQVEIETEIEAIRLEKHQSQLLAHKTQAEKAARAEEWDEAMITWESYLKLEPDDQATAEKSLLQARKYAKISTDYAAAQESIRKKRYGRAIELLQGIIAQEPTYKSTSRLLVEAVEANKAIPVWRRAWALGGAGIILILAISAGLFWLGKNAGLFTTASKTPQRTESSQIISTSEGTEAGQIISTPEETDVVQGTPTQATKTLLVSSADDSGPGTLRQALIEARSGDTITFDPITFSPTNPKTIQLESSLRILSQGHLTLDASNAGVILDGSQVGGEWTPGIEITSTYNVVKGLQVIHFSGPGILLNSNARFNRIGGYRTIGDGPIGQGNLFSGNADGIALRGSDNWISGNLIGTDASASAKMGNAVAGIFLEENASRNTIGPDNIIAYNGTSGGGCGIEIRSEQASANQISENLIFDNQISNPDENAISGICYDMGETSQYINPLMPVILYFDLDAGVVHGQTCAECVVEIFSTDSQDGKVFEGKVTADEIGNFVFKKGEVLSGPFLTATSLTASENTSEFSLPTPARSAIRLALEQIQNQEPAYQTGFEVWEFGEPVENVRVEDGKLVVTSKGEHISVGVNTNGFDNFVLEFDLKILESGPEGHCIFYTNNGSSGDEERVIAAGFHIAGSTNLATLVKQDTQVDLAYGTFDTSSTNKVRLVVLGNQIADFINGQLVNTAIDPRGSAVYNNFSFAASHVIACEYDNFKVWDLSDLDMSDSLAATPEAEVAFYEPILAYMEVQPPTFEDDFSPGKPGWGGDSEGTSIISGSKIDGALNLNDTVNWGDNPNPDANTSGVSFPTNGLFDAADFALKFLFSMNDWDTLNVLFHSASTQDTGYRFTLYSSRSAKGWELINADSGDVIASGTQSQAGGTLLLIARGDKVAILLNNILLYQGEGFESLRRSNRIRGYGESDINSNGMIEAQFDNFMFWNLEGVKIDE